MRKPARKPKLRRRESITHDIAQETQGIEQAHFVALFCQANRHRRNLDSCARHRDSHTHLHLGETQPASNCYLGVFDAGLGAIGTSMPSRIR